MRTEFIVGLNFILCLVTKSSTKEKDSLPSFDHILNDAS